VARLPGAGGPGVLRAGGLGSPELGGDGWAVGRVGWPRCWCAWRLRGGDGAGGRLGRGGKAGRGGGGVGRVGHTGRGEVSGRSCLRGGLGGGRMTLGGPENGGICRRGGGLLGGGSSGRSRPVGRPGVDGVCRRGDTVLGGVHGRSSWGVSGPEVARACRRGDTALGGVCGGGSRLMGGSQVGGACWQGGIMFGSARKIRCGSTRRADGPGVARVCRRSGIVLGRVCGGRWLAGEAEGCGICRGGGGGVIGGPGLGVWDERGGAGHPSAGRAADGGIRCHGRVCCAAWWLSGAGLRSCQPGTARRRCQGM
jgi:hypothetical protein